MTTASDEIYRDKYLKYKKKYTAALENMKGGFELSSVINEPTAFYITDEVTYNYAKKIFYATEIADGSTVLIPSKFSDCVKEIFTLPYDAIQIMPLKPLESSNAFTNTICYVSGKEIKDPYSTKNVGPLFEGLSFGEKRTLSSYPRKFTLEWDNKIATAQLRNIKPKLGTWLSISSVRASDTEAPPVKVYAIARVDNTLYFCGEIN